MTITAVLPRGEAIKNFVYTGALSAETDVISIVPNQRIADQVAARVRTFTPLEPAPVHPFLRAERELLNLAHTRWLWSEAARDHAMRLDEAAKQSSAHRARRALKKLAVAAIANRPGIAAMSALDRIASDRLDTGSVWEQRFREAPPSLVFNGSHIHNDISAPVIRAAQRAGIRTAAFCFSWDNLTSQGRMMPTYDHYLVWNEAIKADLQRIYPGIRSDDVTVTGTPQFDFHFRPELAWSREALCARLGLDPARPYAIYSTSMPYHTPEEPRVVAAIADALRGMKGVDRPQLVVRVYPKDTSGRFTALAAEGLPDVVFPPVDWELNWLTPTLDDCALFSNLLRHCALGINVASTVSLELCMFDKPAINIAFDPPGADIRPISYARYYEFDHYRPVAQSGAIDVVRDPADLSRSLQRAFDAPEERASAREALVRRMFGSTLDGRVAARVAQTLDALAGRG